MDKKLFKILILLLLFIPNNVYGVTINDLEEKLRYLESLDSNKLSSSELSNLTYEIMDIDIIKNDIKNKIKEKEELINSYQDLLEQKKLEANEYLKFLQLSGLSNAYLEYIFGAENFADLMNKKASEMGLVNSHFATPHGLDQEKHYTTAYELACMADYGLNIPKFKEIVNSKSYNITINARSSLIGNTNELLGSLNGVYGVKTGFTNGAGRCLVTSCKRDDLDIITVVLGADTKKIRTLDSMKLIEYAYQNYKVIDIKKIVDEQFEKWKYLNKNRIYINKAKENEIDLKIEDMQYNKIAILKQKSDDVKIEVNSLYYLEAPVHEKQVIGNVKVKISDTTITTLKIFNTKTIAKKEIFDYFIDFLSLVP